jgi:hypothetical protein
MGGFFITGGFTFTGGLGLSATGGGVGDWEVGWTGTMGVVVTPWEEVEDLGVE